jgi:hypothetical protein
MEVFLVLVSSYHCSYQGLQKMVSICTRAHIHSNSPHSLMLFAILTDSHWQYFLEWLRYSLSIRLVSSLVQKFVPSSSVQRVWCCECLAVSYYESQTTLLKLRGEFRFCGGHRSPSKIAARTTGFFACFSLYATRRGEQLWKLVNRSMQLLPYYNVNLICTIGLQQTLNIVMFI